MRGRRPKSLAQIAFEANDEPSYVWDTWEVAGKTKKTTWRRIARAVERAVLRRERAALANAAMEILEARGK